MRFSNSLVIRRPPGVVFRALADPDLIPAWNPAIDAARALTPGPFGSGTRLQLQRTTPRPATEELEVAEYVPDRLLMLRGDFGPFRGHLAYELEEVAEGTRLTNDAELEASGPLRALDQLAAGRVRRSVADNLDGLRRLLEASAPHAVVTRDR